MTFGTIYAQEGAGTGASRRTQVQAHGQGGAGGDRDRMLVVADRKRFFFDMSATRSFILVFIAKLRSLCRG